MIIFADTSALIKYYVQETGSAWVTGLLDPAAAHIVACATVTRVEAAAALTTKFRQGGLSSNGYQTVLSRLSGDFTNEYLQVAVDQRVVELGVLLAQRQKLRGYDAIQLACAMTLDAIALRRNQPPLLFLTADNDLQAAARSEGLLTDNPLAH